MVASSLRMARGCTRRPKATFSNTVMWRNSASNSPWATLRSTLSSAAKLPNFLTMFLTSMVTWLVPWFLSFVEAALENGLHDQRDQRQHRQQRRNRKRRYELIFIVENLDQQRHGVGL